MRDTLDLIKKIKKIAIEAVENSKPTSIFFGKVINTEPLEIKLDNKIILSKPHLVLTRNVIIDHDLILGDEVMLIRVQGGQKFAVIDKVVDFWFRKLV